MPARRKARPAARRKPKRAAQPAEPAPGLAMRAEAWQPAGEVVFSRSWPSRLDAKQEALDTLIELMVGRGWVAAEDRSWLALCLDEAVTNAMLHGNEGDPRLAVDVVVALDAGRWWMSIGDQGQGFTPASVPDPEDPASLLLEHGRGIRLMRSWLESLTYWRNGATVVLCRRRSDTGKPP